MNPKEIREIRNRFQVNRNSATRIYGCYVNSEGNIIACINEYIGNLTDEETDRYFGLPRKMLSGKLGKDFLELEFSQEQESGEVYQSLLKAREGDLPGEFRDRFYNRIIASLSMEENYVILLVEDKYDVPTKQADGENSFNSGEVFRYITCVVCPVKHGKPELGFESEEKRFHSARILQMIGQPVLGFMFPAFTDRSTDIHHAMVYSKGEQMNYEPFIIASFGPRVDVPLTGNEQNIKFNMALEDKLDEECTFDTIQAMHQTLADRVALHKESKISEPLVLMPAEIGEILKNAGTSQTAVSEFEDQIEPLCKEGSVKSGIQVSNITDEKKMTIETAGVKISVKPGAMKAIKAEKRNGRPIIVINVNDFCTINGVKVSISTEE